MVGRALARQKIKGPIYIASQNHGKRLGWGRVEGRVTKLPDFIRAAKENTALRG